MEAVPLKAHGRHLRVGDSDAGGIVPAVEFSTDVQAGAAVGRTDETDDRRQIDERRAPPVHRDVREQAVLDLVPFARARREVTDGDGEPGAVGELLQLPLPEAELRAVAATGIGGDDQRRGVAIDRTPATNRRRRTPSGPGCGGGGSVESALRLRRQANNSSRAQWP